MYINKNTDQHLNKYSINNKTLICINSIKDLDVIVNNKLNFK